MRSYFHSGWAFFTPYLLSYLVYAWQGWPVNPTDRTHGTTIPSLLHVYCIFHVLHLVLGGVTLVSLRQRVFTKELPPKYGGLETAFRLSPWVCLAAILWVPGVYIEWPSDAWQHLRRINEWQIHNIATAHSQWNKFSYFIPYSLTVPFTGSEQLRWLNIYCCGVSLLLCRQYFLLALDLGLAARWAFLFVLASLLSMGNVGFSYIRYYGLSSSVIGHLCALALLRLSIRLVTRSHTAQQFWTVFASGGLLCGIMLLSHGQSLAIAGLSSLSVLAWKLTSLGLRALMMIVILIGASVCIGFTIDIPAVVARIPDAASWFTSWNGFALFTKKAPAVSTLQIIGWFGIVNLAAGVVLLRKNHLAGWLSVGPLVALSLPIFALPIAIVLASRPPAALFLFQRTLFCVPAGLALVCTTSAFAAWHPEYVRRFGFICLVSLLGVFVVASPGAPAHNRLWHLLFRAKSPLTSTDFRALQEFGLTPTDRPKNLASRGLAYSLNAFAPRLFPYQERYIAEPASGTLQPILGKLRNDAGDGERASRMLIAEIYQFPTQYSFSGAIIGHWYAHQLSIDLAGQPELTETAEAATIPLIHVPIE